MSTAAQIDANRTNAQQSTGPQTDAGKQASSQNAFKHGLRSSNPVPRGEDPAGWLAFAQEVIAECDPVGIRQRLLAERIAFLQWKLLRVPEIEVMLMNTTRNRLRDHSRQQGVDVPLYPPAGMLVANNLDTMLRMQSYEMRLQGALASAQRELRQLQEAAAEERGRRQEQKKPEAPTNPPAPSAVEPAPVASGSSTPPPADNSASGQGLGENWVRSAESPPGAIPPPTVGKPGGVA